jgi:hypothetical protein
MPDAAAAAGQVKGQVRTHQGPAHTRPVADRGVDVGDRGDSLGNGVDRLAPQRGLQPVGDVSRDLAADLDRPLADRGVEGECALDAAPPSNAPILDESTKVRSRATPLPRADSKSSALRSGKDDGGVCSTTPPF